MSYLISPEEYREKILKAFPQEALRGFMLARSGRWWISKRLLFWSRRSTPCPATVPDGLEVRDKDGYRVGSLEGFGVRWFGDEERDDFKTRCYDEFGSKVIKQAEQSVKGWAKLDWSLRYEALAEMRERAE